MIKEDPDDDRILECAIAAGSDYIVSEDKDLLRMREFRGTPIQTIREFIDWAWPRPAVLVASVTSRDMQRIDIFFQLV